MTSLAPTLLPHSASPLWREALQAISDRVDGMLEPMPVVREGTDIEGVHDMRVGSRRLVAAMKVFSHCFPDREFRDLMKEARRVTRALGSVRDLDVLIDRFQQDAGKVKEGVDQHRALSYLLDRLERQRRRARKPMLADLDLLEEDRYGTRLREYLRREGELYAGGQDAESLAGAASEPAEEGVTAHTPFPEAGRLLIGARLEELYRFAPYTSQPEAVEELHEMRIAAKWLRYTMELFSDAYADGLKKPLSVVKKFQELLGDLHDADVRLELLRDTEALPLKAGSLNRNGLLTPDPVQAGLRELISANRAERAATYAEFHREWCKQEAKGFRAALQERINRSEAQ